MAPILILYTLLATCYGTLYVPGLTSYKYHMTGDITLGVFQNVLNPGRDLMCDNNSLNTFAMHTCEGAIFALKEINGRQDLLPNITLGMLCMDSCMDPFVALGQSVYMVPDYQQCAIKNTNKSHSVYEYADSIAKEHHEVVGVVGPGLSSLSKVISSFLKVFRIPLLGPHETSDELSDKKHYEYFLRLVPPDRFQSMVFGDIIKHFGWTYVGLFYSADTYGESGAEGIRHMAVQHDFCLAYTYRIYHENILKEADLVRNILETYENARIVVWFVDQNILRHIFGLLQKDFIQKYIFIFSDSAVTVAADFPHMFKGGIMPYFITRILPGYQEYWKALLQSYPLQTNGYKYWFELLDKSEFNCSTYFGTCNHIPYDSYWLHFQWIASDYYDATYVFATALHNIITFNCPNEFKGQETFNTSCIQGYDLLKSMKSLTFNTPTGRQIAFDRNGDSFPIYKLVHFTVDEKGRGVQRDLGVWDYFKNSMIIDYDKLRWEHLVINVSIKSFLMNETSVPMSFCSSECEKRQYKIQLSPECCWECRWCRSNEKLDNNKSTCVSCPLFTWPDQDTALMCVPIAPDYIKWSDKISIIFLTLASLGVTLSITFFLVIWKHRNTRLVKATNKEQSFLILFGTSIASMSILAFVYKPTTSACYMREIAFHVVVCLLYSPLLVKTFRIYCIFTGGKKGKQSPVLAKLSVQRILTGIIILCEIVLLIAVKVAYPTTAKLVMPVLTEGYVELTCHHHILAFLLPVSYNVVTILLCAVLGYSARKLPDNYNESAFIFVSVTTTLFAWAVFLPTYFTASSAAHQTTILALCLMINAYVTMLCMFAPKVYALYYVDESAIKFTTTTTLTSTISTVAT